MAFSGFRQTSLFRFSADHFGLFRLSATFLGLFRLSPIYLTPPLYGFLYWDVPTYKATCILAVVVVVDIPYEWVSSLGVVNCSTLCEGVLCVVTPRWRLWVWRSGE